MKQSHLFLCLLALGVLTGCYPTPRQLEPIETPGAIYQVTSSDTPVRLRRWNYDDEHMLVTVGEKVVLYDWLDDEQLRLSGPESSADLAQSPDGNTVAYTTGTGEIRLLDASQQTSEPLGMGSDPSFSPSGEQLALWRDKTLILVNIDTLIEKAIYEITDPRWQPDLDRTCCTAWSPMGDRIAFQMSLSSDMETQIVVVNVATGQEKVVALNQLIFHPSWAPDGRLLAYVDQSGYKTKQLRIIDIDHGCTVGYKDFDELTNAQWSPDGGVIAVDYGSQIYFIDVGNVFGTSYAELKCP